ncbi:MAG: hypothetical protein ACU0DK_00395 [Pseudooceanicola sp.]
MKRTYFALAAALALCLLPIAGTLADKSDPPRRTVQMHQDTLSRLN